MDTDDASIVPYPISEEFLLSCPFSRSLSFFLRPSLSVKYSLLLLSISSRGVNGFSYEARVETRSE